MTEWVNVGWVNVGWVNDGVGKCPGISKTFGKNRFCLLKLTFSLIHGDNIKKNEKLNI